MANFRFPNIVYCTMKNFSPKRRRNIIMSLYKSAALKNYKVEPLNEGYVMTYELAKNFNRYFHLHCSRYFTLSECGFLKFKKLIGEADFDEAMKSIEKPVKKAEKRAQRSRAVC